ncbi:hypothetical protein L7F22_030366 [Adiantum nelumboides]|nr:hypothetical protein [Adiantum nelumboides]
MLTVRAYHLTHHLPPYVHDWEQSLAAQSYAFCSPTPSAAVQGLLCCLTEPSFHAALLEAECHVLNDESGLILCGLLDVIAWFKLYKQAHEDPKVVVQKLKEVAASLHTIAEADDKAHNEWLECGPNFMRRWMESHGRKLKNEPITWQRRKILLNGLSEVSMAPTKACSNALIPDDLDEEEQRIVDQEFIIASLGCSLNKKPFETYTDPFIPTRLLEVFMADAQHKPWALEYLLLTLINDTDKIALKLGLQQVLETNSSNLLENTLMATPFSMSSFETKRCNASFGCVIGVKGIISTTERDKLHHPCGMCIVHFLNAGVSMLGKVTIVVR